MDIMKMGKNPNYLGSWDLEDLPNREITLTIEKIVDEKAVANGKEEVCTVCYWTDKAYKPMILNVTNKKMICKLYKTKETEKLAGKAVVIGVEQVKAFGDVHDALRIRKRIPKVEAAVKCADCGADIQGAYGKGPEYIAMYTKKQYGVSLCSACASKRAEVKQNAED
jgi:hypothetical protein